MKLIKIDGKIWELSALQDDKYVGHENDNTSLSEMNIFTIKGKTWFRGIVRPLVNNTVKSKATATIEIEVNGLPHQMTYEIYHNSKGFFCNVQGRRVFLKDLLDD